MKILSKTFAVAPTLSAKTFYDWYNRTQALPIQAVQQFAGHSNITTTKKYYLAVRQDDIEKAGVFLNQLLAESKRG